MQELKICDSANFVTLTYNDKYRPGQLVKKDVQLFIKRVRANVEPIKIRYFFVGEYGPETGREHYHGIIFNLPDELEVLNKWTKEGESMGFVHVGTVTQASIHYVTKYMLKDLTKRPYGCTPPFAIMSKKPPLGINYVTDHKNYHASRTDSYATLEGGIKQRLPRIFKDKLFDDGQRAEVTAASRIFVEQKISAQTKKDILSGGDTRTRNTERREQREHQAKMNQKGQKI